MKKLLLLGSVFALASVASAQAQGDATSTAPAVKKTQANTAARLRQLTGLQSQVRPASDPPG